MCLRETNFKNLFFSYVWTWARRARREIFMRAVNDRWNGSKFQSMTNEMGHQDIPHIPTAFPPKRINLPQTKLKPLFCFVFNFTHFTLEKKKLIKFIELVLFNMNFIKDRTRFSAFCSNRNIKSKVKKFN